MLILQNVTLFFSYSDPAITLVIKWIRWLTSFSSHIIYLWRLFSCVDSNTLVILDCPGFGKSKDILLINVWFWIIICTMDQYSDSVCLITWYLWQLNKFKSGIWLCLVVRCSVFRWVLYFAKEWREIEKKFKTKIVRLQFKRKWDLERWMLMIAFYLIIFLFYKWCFVICYILK